MGGHFWQSDLLEKQAMATNMGDEVRRLREANKVQYVQWKKMKKTCIMYIKYTKLLDLSVKLNAPKG